MVAINDTLGYTTAAQSAGENYTVLQTAALGSVIRGVAIAPVPEPSEYLMMLLGLGLLGFAAPRRKS